MRFYHTEAETSMTPTHTHTDQTKRTLPSTLRSRRMHESPAYLLGEAEDGLLLVVRIGAEALDVHPPAQPL